MFLPQLEQQLGFRPAVSLAGTVADQRQALVDGCAARDKASLTAALADGVAARDTSVPSSDGYAVPVRIYTKKTDTERTKSGSGRPAAVYIHGGGWTLGGVPSDDLHARKLALDADHVVVSVEYRLAPEHRYPTAGEDCYAVLRWVRANAASLGADPRQIYVTGNSAGGHLSAVTALMVAQSDQPDALAAQVLRIPLTVHPARFPGSLPDRATVPVYNDHAAVSMFSGLTYPTLFHPVSVQSHC